MSVIDKFLKFCRRFSERFPNLTEKYEKWYWGIRGTREVIETYVLPKFNLPIEFYEQNNWLLDLCDNDIELAKAIFVLFADLQNKILLTKCEYLRELVDFVGAIVTYGVTASGNIVTRESDFALFHVHDKCLAPYYDSYFGQGLYIGEQSIVSENEEYVLILRADTLFGKTEVVLARKIKQTPFGWIAEKVRIVEGDYFARLGKKLCEDQENPLNCALKINEFMNKTMNLEECPDLTEKELELVIEEGTASDWGTLLKCGYKNASDIIKQKLLEKVTELEKCDEDEKESILSDLLWWLHKLYEEARTKAKSILVEVLQKIENVIAVNSSPRIKYVLVRQLDNSRYSKMISDIYPKLLEICQQFRRELKRLKESVKLRLKEEANKLIKELEDLKRQLSEYAIVNYITDEADCDEYIRYRLTIKATVKFGKKWMDRDKFNETIQKLKKLGFTFDWNYKIWILAKQYVFDPSSMPQHFNY